MTDLDPLLREAMARVEGPIDARPSLTDVRRRARRRTHRRMAVVGSALACTGVATAALVIRRDGLGSPAAGISADASSPEPTPTTVYAPAGIFPTTSVFGAPTLTITASVVWDALWNARYDPSGAGREIGPVDQAAADVMPTAQQFGCTSGECASDVHLRRLARDRQDHRLRRSRRDAGSEPGIDFSAPPVEGAVLQTPYSPVVVPPDASGNETPTTISVFDGVMLIDGGAPAGAMEDVYQRLAGYNRTIVPGSGKTVEQTMVMPIGGIDAMATSVGTQLGIDGFDTFDPSFLGAPIQGMVAVVIGPDYFDRVHTPVPTTPAPTTTSIG